ncbi:hypothetical protein FDP41_009063 [Naegleria fowleri]|uniref:DH domain-containing protein n=1 Tax=Naegleria fowleri TaxID=5763 RepID=A0A6A5BFK4_NAEFO|nr:uncharacterized protein FDP41_009063 [Naegleria fowleri]KAF0972814.1 hypothetical protein FDP41_009063 [Naegleria fowleri]CAG4719672.1 unnamed protein product [Naegleria fowleri]
MNTQPTSPIKPHLSAQSQNSLSMKPIQSRNIHCKVIYDFEAKEKQELSVQCGELVEVVKRYKDGWSWCIVMREEGESYGLIPTAYLHEVQPHQPSSSSSESGGFDSIHSHPVLHSIAKIIQEENVSLSTAPTLSDMKDECSETNTMMNSQAHPSGNTQIVFVDEDGMVSNVLTFGNMMNEHESDVDTCTTTNNNNNPHSCISSSTTTTFNSNPKKEKTKFLKRLGSFFQKPASNGKKSNTLSEDPNDNNNNNSEYDESNKKKNKTTNASKTLKPHRSMLNLKKQFSTLRIRSSKEAPTTTSSHETQQQHPNQHSETLHEKAFTLQPQKRAVPSSRISPLEIKTSIELMTQLKQQQEQQQNLHHHGNSLSILSSESLFPMKALQTTAKNSNAKRRSQDSTNSTNSSPNNHHQSSFRDSISFNLFSKHRRSRKKNAIPTDRAVEILLNNLDCFKRRRQFRLYIKKDETLKKQRRRLELIKETIETERTYVNLLKTFIEVFYYPIINDSGYAKGVLRKETTTTLFSNIEQIYQINHTLLNDWEREFQLHYPFIQIGSAFSQICPFLKAYTIYINNFDKAQETFEKLRDKDKKFKEYLQECYRNKQTKGHQLGGFLILPVQRIPRYKMLIQEILHLTSQDHVEYEILKKCSIEIESIASYVNDEKKKVEQNQVVFEVQNLVQKHYNSFIQPNRKFVRRGTMRVRAITHHIEQQLMDGRSSKSIRPVSLIDIMNSMVCKEAKFDIFLFTDVLVLIERDKSKNNHSSQIMNPDSLHFIFLQFVDCRDFTKYSPSQSQRQFIDSPNALLSNHNQKRSSIHLKDNTITRVEYEDCTFTLEALIKSVKTEYTFHCTTVDDKMSWMSSIKDCLENISRSNISKGIDQDMFIVGKERASLNRIAKYKLEEHQKLEKSNLMKISYLTQLDQHLTKKKQQLAKLQKEISIYEMDKEQVLSDVKCVTEKKNKIREDLKSYYASIQEKDLACMKLLNEDHAFKLVFDDVPSVDIQAAYSYMTKTKDSTRRKTSGDVTLNPSNDESSDSP